MSTILEALKKSEQERKLNSVPTLADMTAPQETRRWPLWSILLLVVCMIALIVAMTWWLWPAPSALNSAIAITNDSVAQSQQQNDNDQILVNVISYSQMPEKRFVMINGRMYRENEFVRAGLKVEAINADEVVLNLRGKRIKRSP